MSKRFRPVKMPPIGEIRYPDGNWTVCYALRAGVACVGDRNGKLWDVTVTEFDSWPKAPEYLSLQID